MIIKFRRVEGKVTDRDLGKWFSFRSYKSFNRHIRTLPKPELGYYKSDVKILGKKPIQFRYDISKNHEPIQTYIKFYKQRRG